MSNTRNTGFLTNVVKYTDKGDISFVSGSTTLMSISSSGAVTVTGVISGSNALTSSYSQNSELLDNLDSTSFVFTSSFNTYSSSMSTRVTNNESTGSTLTSASASLNTASGSFSTRVTRIEGNYATTGSNVFLGAQTVCANITSTGTIIAQTLNVQQVTSSVVYSSGSNVFGCSLTNTQQFTGSVLVTGSLTVTTAGTSPEFQVNSGGTIKGNALTDVHNVTGSLRITGSGNHFILGCNLLIGTTTSTLGKLEVIGSGGVRVNEDGAGTKVIQIRSDFAGVDPAINVSTNNALLLQTNNTERIRITSAGIACFACQVCTTGLVSNGAATICGAGTSLSLNSTDGTPVRLKILRSTVPTYLTDIYTAATTAGSSWSINKADTSAGSSTWAASDNTAYSTSAIRLVSTTSPSSIEFYTATAANTNPTLRALIDGSGIACFSCQVCAPILVASSAINSGISMTSPVYCVNTYNSLSATPSGQMGVLGHNAITCTSVANTIVQMNNGYYASFVRQYYNEGITFYTRANAGTAGDVLYGAGAVTDGADRLRITSTGIACFACQVCAPGFIGRLYQGCGFSSLSAGAGTGTASFDTITRTGVGLYEVSIIANPNAGGSDYYDFWYGHVLIGRGYSGTAVTDYLVWCQESPPPRCLYPSGGGGLIVTACMFQSGVESTCIGRDGSYTIRFKIAGYNSSYTGAGTTVFLKQII